MGFKFSTLAIAEVEFFSVQLIRHFLTRDDDEIKKIVFTFFFLLLLSGSHSLYVPQNGFQTSNFIDFQLGLGSRMAAERRVEKKSRAAVVCMPHPLTHHSLTLTRLFFGRQYNMSLEVHYPH